MHLVRNAVDHGIELPDVREASGKPRVGRIIIEANNVGSDVLVSVRDDGKGLNKQKILQKAVQNGLINKQEHELTEKEIYNLIFIPGFSTNDNVTEYSGRGVGMDVVTKNIEEVGGAVSVVSAQGAGTITTMKIPLTLAIIDGMNIRVGSSIYTIPTTSIQETFRAKEKDIVTDPEDNEMIMVRGSCYPVLRLHRLYEVEADTNDMTKGIMLMVESDGKSLCLFADELLGQHQVVVKALPAYIKLARKIKGLAGCTLLGDGSISLILSVGELMTA
jgi:two-component system chemotaxis sensor kinase CheA